MVEMVQDMHMQRRSDDMAPICCSPLALIIIFLPLVLLIIFAIKLMILTPSKSKALALPPGPPSIFVLTTVAWQWLLKDEANLDDILSKLWAKYGPIISIRLPFFKPLIFIADRSLAYDALIRHGAVFVDRPSSALHTISLTPYGPLWRSLRRNLASETLHPSRLNGYYTDTRKLVLRMLLEELHGARQATSGIVVVKQSVDFAMFSLLAFMSFGKELDLDMIRQLQDVLRRLFSPLVVKMKVVGMFPKITGMVFRKSMKKMLEIVKEQEDLLKPLIRGRYHRIKEARGDRIVCYVDSLLELSVAEEGGRSLSEEELLDLCREFLVAGSHTTAVTMEWTMAELVKHQGIQEKLSEEIRRVLVDKEEGSIVEEEDLTKMSYLRAVILETLRLHPGGSFLIPHATTEDAQIGGYVVPKESTVIFMVNELARDEKVWADPMEFRPERFLAGGEGEGVDITGSREIKMMTFGAGRRICPGVGLAMLHLQYFVANLVREFEWRAVDGEEVDLSEKWELTVSLKNHLRAEVVPRQRGQRFPTERVLD